MPPTVKYTLDANDAWSADFWTASNKQVLVEQVAGMEAGTLAEGDDVRFPSPAIIVADSAARKLLATYTALQVVPYVGMRVTQLDQNSGDYPTVEYMLNGEDVTLDVNWFLRPLANPATGELVFDLRLADFAGIVPPLNSIGQLGGKLRIGDGATTGGVTPVDRVTAVTATGDVVLAVPVGTFAPGDKAKYYITASGADRNFKVNANIVVPSDSLFDNSVGKTLESGKTYIVQLEYVGSFWILTTIVGGGALPN